MMAHNLCYTTLLDAKVVNQLGLKKDVDYIVTPNNGKAHCLFSLFSWGLYSFRAQISLSSQANARAFCQLF